MTHPDCDHVCTSDCRREGCECLCGEYHNSMTAEELIEAKNDGARDLRIDIVKIFLMKYVELKPEYDGMMCYTLSAKIVDALFPETK